MGNSGNTMDRWYRRAALVVWPRDRAFAARAEAGSQWALSELHTRIEAGDLEGARAAAESLAPFWKKIRWPAELLGTALRVAAGLGAAGTAAMLLEPFRVETVTPEHAGRLAAARGQYGEEWTRGVIDRVVRVEALTSRRTDTSGSKGCQGCAGRCVPPGVRRWRRLPATGTCKWIGRSAGDTGQAPRRHRSGSRGSRC